MRSTGASISAVRRDVISTLGKVGCVGPITDESLDDEQAGRKRRRASTNVERGSKTFPGTSMVVTDLFSIVHMYTSLF